MYGIKDVWVFSHNIIRTGRQFVNDALRPLELSSAEGNILLHLLTQGDLVRQDDIVESLDISKPAVSRALDSLAEKGYVVREKDLSDRRASVVLLTDKARQIGPRVEQIYEEVFSIAAEGVSDEELKAFAHLFYRVSENFSRARKSQGGRS